MKTSGIEALLEMLAQQGVRYLFGNPGTTELPLNDALVARPAVSIHPRPAGSAGDGDGRRLSRWRRGTLGVVNLHISCGLGNAMGMLYNAFREGTPLLVTAGPARPPAEIRGADPVGPTWSTSRGRGRSGRSKSSACEDLPAAVRRAVQTALTPPTGPVFMSLPIDVQLRDGRSST